jgi:hypothetical protein
MTTTTTPPTITAEDPIFDEVHAEAARLRRLAFKFGDGPYVPGARYHEMPRLAKAAFLEGLCEALADHWAGREPR